MEPDAVNSIANLIFNAMDTSSWKQKSADQIELFVQQLLSQIANSLMQDFLFPALVDDIQRQVESLQVGCPQCNSPLRLHKRNCSIHPKTIFADKITITRNQYYCGNCDAYLLVADSHLDLVSRHLTPRLALIVALCGASWSYPVAAAFLCFLFGVQLSEKTIENVTTDERLLPQALEEDPLDKPPGVVAMDGVLIRGREKHRWLEMKVGSFFSQVVEVSKDRKEVMDASFVASSCEEWKDFVGPVTQEAERRGVGPTSEIEFLSDGAEGIWSLCEMVFPYARARLDLYHGKRKISQRTRQAYKDNESKKRHQEKLQEMFSKGLIDEAVIYLQKQMPRTSHKREALRKLIGYLRRNEKRIPNYEEVKEEGGTVSSGLMEKANDLIVVRRMKEGIMHWSREGSNPVLQHRTAFINKHARSRTGSYELAFCQALC